MKRTLLIAQREFMAYAKTAGFWLSLLAFPLFAVLGGGIPFLIRSAEPVRQVAIIDETPQGSLAGAVRAALEADQRRSDIDALRMAAIPEAGTTGGDRVRAAAEAGGYEAGLAELRRIAPRAGAGAKPAKRQIVLVAPPASIADAQPGAERDAAIREALETADREERPLSAVVLLNQQGAAPSARVWTERATDTTVESAIRDALRDVNRQSVFVRAGVDPEVVRQADRFRPEVSVFSPRATSGGEVSFRDRLPGLVGLVFGFLLWSLIITGASILLNSVMEEKSNKILEVLLSSASATEILTGKVLGVAFLTGTVLLVWAGIGAAGLQAGVPDVARDVMSVLMRDGLLIYFLLYTVGGYLMYAVLFAAIGAFCETPRDAQTLMGPIMMILVVPILVMQMALRTPDATVVKVLSWIPFFTPFLMSARAPSDPALIEIVLTLLGMFGTALLTVWMAGRAFRAGALSDVKLSWKSFGRAVTGRS